jgi:hypothetical protein
MIKVSIINYYIFRVAGLNVGAALIMLCHNLPGIKHGLSNENDNLNHEFSNL